MRLSILKFTALSAISLSMLLAQSIAHAQRSTRFFCDNYSGEHVTYANNGNGNVPLVKWRDDFFGGSGWTAGRRCDEVSARFQVFNDAGRLEYLTTGVVNRYPVICAAFYFDGPCEDGNVLITLRPNADPNLVLMELTETRRARTNGGPLLQSGNRVFVDVDALIESRSTTRRESGYTPSRTQDVQPNDDRIW